VKESLRIVVAQAFTLAFIPARLHLKSATNKKPIKHVKDIMIAARLFLNEASKLLQLTLQVNCSAKKSYRYYRRRPANLTLPQFKADSTFELKNYSFALHNKWIKHQNKIYL
jgi:hypothetical protein